MTIHIQVCCIEFLTCWNRYNHLLPLDCGSLSFAFRTFKLNVHPGSFAVPTRGTHNKRSPGHAFIARSITVRTLHSFCTRFTSTTIALGTRIYYINVYFFIRSTSCLWEWYSQHHLEYNALLKGNYLMRVCQIYVSGQYTGCPRLSLTPISPLLAQALFLRVFYWQIERASKTSDKKCHRENRIFIESRISLRSKNLSPEKIS